MHVGGGSVVVSVTTQWCLRRVQRAVCCRACGVHAARNRRAHGMSACVRPGAPWSSGSPRGVKVGVNAAAAKITEHYSPARAGEGDRQTDRLSLRGGRTRSRNNSNRHEFKHNAHSYSEKKEILPELRELRTRKHPPVSGGKRPLCTLGVPPGRSTDVSAGGCARAPCVFLAAAEGTARAARVRPGAGRKTCFVTELVVAPAAGIRVGAGAGIGFRIPLTNRRPPDTYVRVTEETWKNRVFA